MEHTRRLGRARHAETPWTPWILCPPAQLSDSREVLCLNVETFLSVQLCCASVVRGETLSVFTEAVCRHRSVVFHGNDCCLKEMEAEVRLIELFQIVSAKQSCHMN